MSHRRRTRHHGARILAWFRFCGCVFGVAMVTAGSVHAVAAPHDTITSLAALHSLNNDEAAKSIPVAFEATVTYHIKGSVGLFVQDGGLAIYVDAPANVTLTPGDRVLVRGETHSGFRPEIEAESVTVVGHEAVPAPVPASYPQLVGGDFDCVRVSVRGKVRSADLVTYGKVTSIYLEILMDGGFVDAIIKSSDGDMLEKLRGAQVEVAGTTSGKFDSKQQLTGIILKVPAIADVNILKAPPSGRESIPLTPMDGILAHSYVRDLSEEVRVEGTITYYLPGAAVVLQDGEKSLWIETKDEQPLNIGDRATALGYPAVRSGVLTLAAAEVDDSYQRSPIAPQRIGWDELTSGTEAFNLISIEGQVVKEGRDEYQDEYVLTTGGQLFSVLYRHTDEDLGFELPPMKHVPVGATVRVTGISSVTYGSNPFAGPAGFQVLLRSFADLEVVARPSWLNVKNLTRLVEILLAVIFIFGIRVIWTERKARLRNAAVAYLERRRGEILEEINNSRPLAEILESINELVSARLGGAPCWIQVEDGATLGNRLSESALTGLRVVQHPIPSRTGPALGVICAAFHPHTAAGAVETGPLAQAAGLARLAIETSRLYSDLVHRSEFDLLTDIHNRFSFEKQIEIAIEAARQSAGIFGLLYIDLNEFKQVNDQFGHSFGDLYLQEVTMRMKHQLRPGDILARLGGDEFAVILPHVHSRDDVEEIALRLEHCFERPFTWESCTVQGSASIGIALYPADGTTRDSLLSAADAAMYAIKQTRQHS
ncbi:MAG TPA: GGDEF domain-containing protein [Terracidiphilus sp.]|nr:GGDEF domain-containing protein [Terracidiphilus sp.]